MVLVTCDLDYFNMSFKCFETWLKNRVPLKSFIKKESIGMTKFVQIASYLNHKYNVICSTYWRNFKKH